MAIYYHFIEVLDALHSIHWKGKGRTISLIQKALHILPSKRQVIKRILREIMRSAYEGVIFNGKIEHMNKLGCKFIILPGSVEETLITDWMEGYCRFFRLQ